MISCDLLSLLSKISPVKRFRYTTLKHERDVGNLPNPARGKMISLSKKIKKVSGLYSIKYQVHYCMFIKCYFGFIKFFCFPAIDLSKQYYEVKHVIQRIMEENKSISKIWKKNLILKKTFYKVSENSNLFTTENDLTFTFSVLFRYTIELCRCCTSKQHCEKIHHIPKLSKFSLRNPL